MSANSSIEWTDHTFNPWVGCTKVSPGCGHCYAELRDRRHLIEKVDHWGPGAPRLRTSVANWRLPLGWNRANASRAALITLRRQRVFCASMADWLDDEVPIEWLADLLALIHATPNLDWQLLTKRPENWYSRLSLVEGEMAESWIDCIDMPARGALPENVWIGATVEDQARADERIAALMRIPAAVRFLSCEPLLAEVDIWGAVDRWQAAGGLNPSWSRDNPWLLHWVICGGESGPDARPMHPDWARSLRDQCAHAGVPFFFKQWGEWAPGYSDMGGFYLDPGAQEVDRKVKVFEFPPEKSGEYQEMGLIGKKAAGRLLDGVLHDAFPEGARS